MLWHLQIDPAPGQIDLAGRRVAADAAELGLSGRWKVAASRGFLIEGPLDRKAVARAAESVLVDPAVEVFSIRGADEFEAHVAEGAVVHVLPKAGVTDPEAESALALLRDLGLPVENVRTIRTYRVEGPKDSLPRLIGRVLANDAVEQAVVGPLPFEKLGQGTSYRFARVEVPILGKSDAELLEISRKGQLHFSLAEFRAVEAYFAELGRQPTDCEL